MTHTERATIQLDIAASYLRDVRRAAKADQALAARDGLALTILTLQRAQRELEQEVEA